MRRPRDLIDQIADLRARVRQLEVTRRGGTTTGGGGGFVVGDWEILSPYLASSWVPSPINIPRFRVLPFGLQITGLIHTPDQMTPPSYALGGSMLLFTLPPGYRPTDPSAYSSVFLAQGFRAIEGTMGHHIPITCAIFGDSGECQAWPNRDDYEVPTGISFNNILAPEPDTSLIGTGGGGGGVGGDGGGGGATPGTVVEYDSSVPSYGVFTWLQTNDPSGFIASGNEHPAFPAWRLTDDDPTSFWLADAPNAQAVVTWELVGWESTVTGVWFRLEQPITMFRFEGSADGSTWETLIDFNATFTAAADYVEAGGGPYRFFRMTNQRPSENPWVYEIDFFGTVSAVT